VNAQDAKTIISFIKKEVDRNKAELKIDKLQPSFFIGYTLIDSKHLNVNASLGALINSSQSSQRVGYPTLLVGSYARNNSEFLDMNSMYGYGFYPRSVSLENDPIGIATRIWMDLDGLYKDAAEKYEAKIATMRQQNMTEEELAVIDFEKIDPVDIFLKPADVNQDKKYWEDYVRKASTVLNKYPELTRSNISLYNRNTMLYYYNTDNSQYAIPVPYYRLHLHVEAMTKDGQNLYDNLYIEYPTFEQMPNVDDFTKNCEAFIANFLQLLNAPMADDAYSGPVLFEDQAAVEAVQDKFMHQQSLCAKTKPVASDNVRNRFRGNYRLNPNNLEMMMNKKVISRSLSIKSLTGTQEYNGIKLEGYYPVDFEGAVPEKEFFLIENGVLKSMLNRRTPTKRVPASNGHYRFNYNNMSPQIAPGNILVTSNDTYSKEDLKRKLLDAAKEEDLDFAYIVRRMWGNDITMIYKVYVADGREELVRGAKFEDFTLKSFKRVLGAAKENYVRHTANFGSLATYVVPDGILFEELEITRNNNITFETPFVVPQPVAISK
jgi:hypothetical protein